MITISKKDYEILLGKKLIHDIGTILYKHNKIKSLRRRVVVINHSKDIDGNYFYVIRDLDKKWKNDISVVNYNITEYGLSDYTPVSDMNKNPIAQTKKRYDEEIDRLHRIIEELQLEINNKKENQ